MNIDFNTVVPKFDAILKRGLSLGLGDPDGQMCIEAAWCSALGLPHGDDPGCVAKSVRRFKIVLNDRNWSSPRARANGMRDLGIAQLGSLGVVADHEFVKRLAEKTIRVLLPAISISISSINISLDRCEREGTCASARYARDILAAYADAAYANAADAAAYADAAVNAADAGKNRDKHLCLSATLALDVLRELKSPGAIWLDAQN